MTSYGQFCPVSTATDVLAGRWTILVVRSLLSGGTRFGDIQRGVPGCPPATLSKRLKELAAAGIVQRVATSGVVYELTEAGWALEPVVEEMGKWAHHWARSTYGDDLDPELVMWDFRGFLDPAGLGVERAVIELSLQIPQASPRLFWMVVDPGEVDVCMVEPTRPVDVVIDASLRSLARIWQGDVTFDTAIECGEIRLLGPETITRRIPEWLSRHPVLSCPAPEPVVAPRSPSARTRGQVAAGA